MQADFCQVKIWANLRKLVGNWFSAKILERQLLSHFFGTPSPNIGCLITKYFISAYSNIDVTMFWLALRACLVALWLWLRGNKAAPNGHRRRNTSALQTEELEPFLPYRGGATICSSTAPAPTLAPAPAEKQHGWSLTKQGLKLSS